MTLNLNELKRLAEEATPMVGKACIYFEEHHLREGHVDFENADLFIASERPKEDSEYYASVHPASILALIERIQEAETRNALQQRALDEMREQLAAYQQLHEEIINAEANLSVSLGVVCVKAERSATNGGSDL